MLPACFKWLFTAALLSGGVCSANGYAAQETSSEKRPEVYTSPINGSRFWGLHSDDHSVASLIVSPLAVDLELSNEQIEKLRSIYMPVAQRNIGLMMRLRSPSRLEDGEEHRIRAEQATLMSQLNEAMAGVLDDGQRKRLEQISLQLGGPSTLISEPRVLLQLNLSDPQRDKLKVIIAQMWIDEARLKEEYRANQTRPADVGLAIQKDRERAIQLIIGELKPNQVSVLGALLGEPYDAGKLRPDDRYLTPVPWWHGVARIAAER